ncbi:hypothetical protein NsoK4_00115 [Nitrosopumilus sp. K4]|uniref:hypothetical protein n=1 Tax=Nitrosopumilus sp. K4 TaxID=2795383 RepID=UPI001BAB460A|nr:hypothetical protein [Nitrosopumilus sp. K4]QUC64737.1 hypothetical protein NsoK4_00115 [Nitrosopumilus sp. K4]
MDKKFVGIGIGIAVIVAIIAAATMIDSEPAMTQKTNEKIGLVINPPTQSVSLQQIDEIFFDASSSGIGRSNVYLFWNMIEPQRGEFDWSQSDVLMGLNEKNNLKVTLYFSVINGETLGPFPDWIGNPSLNAIGEDRLTNVLDAILMRYHIVDTVIIAGETESQFRYYEQNIPVYKELYNSVYNKLKTKYPDVKFGNSFALHHVLNKDLQNIVHELAIGDFVAFSYSPVDSLNDIVKTPDDAIEDLYAAFELIPDKKVGFFEISWSTSDFVGGNNTSQKEFVEKTFDFYSENESEVEFLTWYRQYDRPEGTCVSATQNIGDEKISVGGGSGLGSSEHVIERLNHYICNAGMKDVDGNSKPAWDEFKNQIEMIN